MPRLDEQKALRHLRRIPITKEVKLFNLETVRTLRQLMMRDKAWVEGLLSIFHSQDRSALRLIAQETVQQLEVSLRLITRRIDELESQKEEAVK